MMKWRLNYGQTYQKQVCLLERFITYLLIITRNHSTNWSGLINRDTSQ